MQIFLESVDKGVWDAKLNGPFEPTHVVNGKTVLKNFSEWSQDENRRAQYDVKARNLIASTLTMDEFFRISQCKTTKEMWDVLKVTQEGIKEVKRARKNSLIHEYELFRMKAEDTIYEVQKRFTHIVNHLMALGKVFDKEDINIKILKSLNRIWQPKVTVISESRDLTSMNMATLFGKLREHELELGRLKEEEEIEEKKSIALKATSKKASKIVSSKDEFDVDLDNNKLMSMVVMAKQRKLQDEMMFSVMSVARRVTLNLNALT
ncbi:uncharacterized protein LOC124821898 [Vigna umbellata]|uniref:uncharacterized protein LOC124821897 n=1 Tax=Vigna umbellata TaxID=87088 RepID=UPI001F5FB0BF|nr:uncharacterized protein LOC124821897 [Vigna umbellata]XP_047149799.1 uncharacterized protein LOC124821898 [Vigna umbellata]